MSKRTVANLKLTAVALGVLTIAGLLASCAKLPRPVTDPAPRITAPLAVVKSEIVATRSEHAAARTDLATAAKLTTEQPAVNAVVRSADQHVAAAEIHVATAATQTDVGTAAAVEVGKQSVTDQQTIRDLQHKIDVLNAAWIGPQLKKWLWVLAIAGAVFFFAMGILKNASEVNPAVGVVRGILLTIGTGTMWLWHKLGHLWADAYHAWWATPGLIVPVKVA